MTESVSEIAEPEPHPMCTYCDGRGYVGLADCPKCLGTGTEDPQ